MEKLVAEKELDVFVVEELLVFESVFNTHLRSFYQGSEECQASIRLLMKLAGAGSVDDLVRVCKLQRSLANKEIKRDQLSEGELKLIREVAQASSGMSMSSLASGILLAARLHAFVTPPVTKRMCGQLREVAKGSGLKVFEGVLLDVHKSEKYGGELHKNLPGTLKAFAALFRARVMRKVQVPSLELSGNMDRAVKWEARMLEHVKEEQEKFPALQVLIKESIPFLEDRIRSALREIPKLKEQEYVEDELSCMMLGFIDDLKT